MLLPTPRPDIPNTVFRNTHIPTQLGPVFNNLQLDQLRMFFRTGGATNVLQHGGCTSGVTWKDSWRNNGLETCWALGILARNHIALQHLPILQMAQQLHFVKTWAPRLKHKFKSKNSSLARNPNFARWNGGNSRIAVIEFVAQDFCHLAMTQQKIRIYYIMGIYFLTSRLTTYMFVGRRALLNCLVWFYSLMYKRGHFLLPTQTMHYYEKGNPSKSKKNYCLISPKQPYVFLGESKGVITLVISISNYSRPLCLLRNSASRNNQLPHTWEASFTFTLRLPSPVSRASSWATAYVARYRKKNGHRNKKSPTKFGVALFEK